MVFLAGMCGHKLNLTAKIRAAIFPRLVHEIMSFVTRLRSQPMSVFVANEYRIDPTAIETTEAER